MIWNYFYSLLNIYKLWTRQTNKCLTNYKTWMAVTTINRWVTLWTCNRTSDKCNQCKCQIWSACTTIKCNSTTWRNHKVKWLKSTINIRLNDVDTSKLTKIARWETNVTSHMETKSLESQKTPWTLSSKLMRSNLSNGRIATNKMDLADKDSWSLSHLFRTKEVECNNNNKCVETSGVAWAEEVAKGKCKREVVGNNLLTTAQENNILKIMVHRVNSDPHSNSSKWATIRSTKQSNASISRNVSKTVNVNRKFRWIMQVRRQVLFCTRRGWHPRR